MNRCAPDQGSKGADRGLGEQHACRPSARRRRAGSNRRHLLMEGLELRAVLAASISGQVFHDLNGDQVRQAEAPQSEPALGCWTVFLDANRNGSLDDGEPRQRTASDGSYSLTVDEPGEYAVTLLTEPGFDQTTPIRFATETHFVSGAFADFVVHPHRSLLFATAGDRVVRIQPDNPSVTSAALAFGESLSAIDISRDGRFLFVGEAASGDRQGKVYRVELATGELHTYTFPLQPGEGGVSDLAYLESGRLFVVTTSVNPAEPPASVPLREVVLATGEVRERQEDFGQGDGQIAPQTRLERSGDATVLLLVHAQHAAGRVDLYSAATDTFPHTTNLNLTLDDAYVALRADGGRIAIQSPSLGTKVFDGELQEVVAPTLPAGELVFDPLRNLLYVADEAADEWVAFDADSGEELYRAAIGTDLTAGEFPFQAQISTRGKVLALATASGLRLIGLDRPIPHLVTVADGENLTGLDFGNWLNGRNRRPVGIDDRLVVAEDTTITVGGSGVVQNDSDPEAALLTAELVSGPEHGVLEFTTTGALRYTPAENFFGWDRVSYLPFDGEFYACQPATVTIEVTPVNDPPVEIRLDTTTIAENAPHGEIGQVVVVDADPGDVVIFVLSDPRFEIRDGVLQVRPGVTLDHEQGGIIDLTITASDGGQPPLSVTTTVQIQVEDVNESEPTIEVTEFDVNDGSTTVGTVTVADDDSSQTVTLTIVSGNDDDTFVLDPITGVLTVNAGHQLDSQQTAVYTLTVQATDSGTPPLSVEGQITIRVHPPNLHDPVLTEETWQIPENRPSGTMVGTVSASDADAQSTFRFRILKGNASGAFHLDPATGKLQIDQARVIDFETAPTFELEIEVSDGGYPERKDTGTITVSVQNVNEAPLGITIDQDSVTDRSPGAKIGQLTVIDPDVGDSHVLTVDDERFQISGRTLRLKPGVTLDSRQEEFVSLNLTATDSGGLLATEALIIRVLPNSQPWRNANNPLDANGDGQVTPGDILVIINEINNPSNTDAGGHVPGDPPSDPNTPYYDVNGDGVISPLDVLIIINELNRGSPGQQAEGESPVVGWVVATDDSDSEDSAWDRWQRTLQAALAELGTAEG